MTDKKYWSSVDVENYLKSLKPGARRVLPDDAYCTENFTWNEVLMTKNRNIDMPSRQILDNLKSTADVLQEYRTEVGRPITITSGWRTPTKQKELINEYNTWVKNGKKGYPKNKPSETSLHLEGLALDYVVSGSQKDSQNTVDKKHFGEREFSSDYTHIGLPTFSKSYLERNHLDVDKFYRKLSDEGITMSDYEKSKILKTMDPRTWNALPSHYDSKSNAATFGNYKPVNDNQVFQDGGDTYNLNNVYKGSVQYNDYLPQYEKDFQDIIVPDIPWEEILPTGYAAPVNTNEQQTDYQEFETQNKSEFYGYTNPLTGNNRIFTREDLDIMSGDDFAQKEKEIMSQMNTIGIPTNGDMKRESMLSGDVIYVHPYVRSDGTSVSGYYRSRARF